MCFLFSETFWVFITAISTLVLAVFTPLQFKSLIDENKCRNKINSATFLNNLKNAFFTEQERSLVLLIAKNELKFDVKNGIFINQLSDDFKRKFESILFLQRPFYLTQEIDDFLLQHFEDASLLEINGVITLYDVDQNFGYYLETCFDNEEIKKYIKWCRKDDNDIYARLEELYNKLHKK
jgi:hypothetical protein